MILAPILLVLASFLPAQTPQPKPVPPPSTQAVPSAPTPKSLYGFNMTAAEMEQDADDLEEATLEGLPKVHAKYGLLIPDAFYNTLVMDVLTLQMDKVTDPSFRPDFNQLGADIDAMEDEIDWVLDHKAI